MDEKRKRAITTGVVVGAVAVGLVVLAKRTPKEKWGETLVKIARDGLKFARIRYGAVAAPLFDVAEQTLDKVEETLITGDNTPKIA
jgi:hypothetical protein